MSFSKNVKTELIEIQNEDCCAHASAYGILLFSRAFSTRDISFLTEHGGVASYYNDAVVLLSGRVAHMQETDGGNSLVSVPDAGQRQRIFAALGIDARGGRRSINFANIQNECCFGAFLRGAFLACGTVTDPNKNYHLEFSVPSRQLCDSFLKVFDEFDIRPRITERNGVPVVYCKNSADIEDILTGMGATESTMEVIGTKVIKDIRNRVNRKCNFETANLERAADASGRQYAAALTIQKHGGFSSLPADLRKLAALRLENPDLTTAELGALLPESLSKSGLHHRLKRIENFAEDLKNK